MAINHACQCPTDYRWPLAASLWPIVQPHMY